MTTPFSRTGATDWFKRWAETLAAVGLATLGIWWFATASALLSWVGGALAVLGSAAAITAFQRARFRHGGGGVGVVQLDEGRLTYFGPVEGGSIAVREVASVGIDPRHRPAHWVFSSAEATLMIPVDAEGVSVLFDVFAQLPGLDPRTVLAARERAVAHPVTLWRRSGRIAPSRRLN